MGNGDLLKSHVQNLKLRPCEITSPSTPSGVCMEAVGLQIHFFSCFSLTDGFGLGWLNTQDLVNCSFLSVDIFALVLGREELVCAAVDKKGRLMVAAGFLQTSNIYLERLGDQRCPLL